MSSSSWLVPAGIELLTTTLASAISPAVSVLWILLPSRQHRDEVVPAVQNHHDQMTKHKGQHGPHHDEVPQARPVKSPHKPCQPGELHWFPDRQTGQDGEHSQCDYSRVRVFLQGIVRLRRGRLLTREEVVLRHGPDAGNVVACKQNLPVIAAEDLV